MYVLMYCILLITLLLGSQYYLYSSLACLTSQYLPMLPQSQSTLASLSLNTGMPALPNESLNTAGVCVCVGVCMYMYVCIYM